MAELGWDARYTLPNLLKLVRNGKYEPMAEGLTEDNTLMQDMQIYPGNGILNHEGSRRTSLPTAQIIEVGAGWDSSVSQWANFNDTISIFKDRFDVAKTVYDRQPNKAQWRADEEDAHVMGFGQSVINHVIYGTSVASAKKFDGLAVRYNTPDSGDPLNPSSTGDPFVFDGGGGTGSDTTSIWLMQHGFKAFHGITPINDTDMGLKRRDAGIQYVTDAVTSKEREDLRVELEQNLGISVETARSVARIRNVPTTLASIATWQTVISKILQARQEVFRGSNPVWMYMNPRSIYLLGESSREKMNIVFDKNNPWDIMMNRFGDMPIRKMDALLNTETGVAAA